MNDQPYLTAEAVVRSFAEAEMPAIPSISAVAPASISSRRPGRWDSLRAPGIMAGAADQGAARTVWQIATVR